jgi:DNA-directed RNA polymerase subunit L
MIARLKDTRELIEVGYYNSEWYLMKEGVPTAQEIYCDKFELCGYSIEEHNKKLNEVKCDSIRTKDELRREVEKLENEIKQLKDKDAKQWENRRFEVAKELLLSSEDTCENIVRLADEFIEQLKK